MCDFVFVELTHSDSIPLLSCREGNDMAPGKESGMQDSDSAAGLT